MMVVGKVGLSNLVFYVAEVVHEVAMIKVFGRVGD